MKRGTLIILLFALIFSAFAQPPIKLKTDNLTVKAGDGTANVKIKGTGDFTIEKFDVNEAGVVILVVDRQTGVMDTLPISELTSSGGGIDTIFQSGSTVYLISGEDTLSFETTDNQQLSISNDTIYLEDGGFVVLPPSSDGNGIYDGGGTLNTFPTTSISGNGAMVGIEFAELSDFEADASWMVLTAQQDLTLDIAGSTGTNGQVLTSDGSNATWQNIPSGGDGNGIYDGGGTLNTFPTTSISGNGAMVGIEFVEMLDFEVETSYLILDAYNDLTLIAENTAGTSGQVLTSDGIHATWQNIKTFQFAEIYIHHNSATSTIVDVGTTYTDITGFENGLSSGDWILTDSSITYTGIETIYATVLICGASYDISGTSKTVYLDVFKNDVNANKGGTTRTVSNGNVFGSSSPGCLLELSTNDEISLKTAVNTGTTDITFSNLNIIVKEL